ncbi:MAG: NTP transferase domain-containing protein [Deferribacteres bacterium]|nr:NTP transferase domain-containing protein [Deferribacteres bacterium]
MIKPLKCLIIAAGKGSRLSGKGDSKPLLPLKGLPIIERVILAAKNCGIENFYVVTGYNGEKVRLFLDSLSRHRNISITHVINDEWDKGNGISVLKAKDVLNEYFLLLMGDHLFDEEIIRRLQRARRRKGEVILGIDSRTSANSLVDIDDVTKVAVKNSKVVDIGKHITQYNAYDTGIFLCSPAIFSAIETSIAQDNDDSLSGGIRVLAREGKARAFDIDGGFWIDIDDEAAFRKAERHLMEKLQKSSDGPVSRYLNRPLSMRLTEYLVQTRITPNQISVISFVLSMAAAAFFFMSGYVPLVIGALIAQASSVIDGCDGEVARLKHCGSDFGGWFDAVLDRYADALMLFGLTWHAYYESRDFLTLFIGFMAVIGAFMNSYTADKYDGFMKKRLGEGRHYFRMGRDVRVFLIFIGALINQPFLILLVIALLMNIENIRRVKVLYENEQASFNSA